MMIISTFPEVAFVDLPKDLQDRIDTAFHSVAHYFADSSVNNKPPTKKQKLLDDNNISPTKDLRISTPSVPQALRELDSLPVNDELLNDFFQELGPEISGGYTINTWREVCAVFVERESLEVGQRKSSASAESEAQPILDERLRNLANQLLQTRNQKPLPSLSALEALSTIELIAVAKTYIDEYPYNKQIRRYWPKQLTPSGGLKALSEKEQKRYSVTLKAFIDFPRDALKVLDRTLKPEEAQRHFILKEILSQRDDLESIGSRHCALLEQIRAVTATPSASQTPTSGGQLPESVLMRDNYRCLMSGTMTENAEDQDRMRLHHHSGIVRRITGQLQIAHGMPQGLQETAWIMLKAITGMSFDGWKADCAENALVLLSSLHALLGAFKLYLELDDDKRLIVRGRKVSDKANPITSLRGVPSAYYQTQNCDRVLLDKPLPLPPPLLSDQLHVPFLDSKFFHLHRLIGDVFWMVASADPSILEPDEDEEDVTVLNDKNIFRVLDKLDSENMEYGDVCKAKQTVPV
ncbi:hypothetical protein BT96DRAFT_417891 [Gymnopus androsaceus JB14]|uniref:Uncharacterized protein n=1 Tax=Gymnopus androsaceus JB14 TaxID=1447944 RepID=A0A6A4I6P2_9AGAR|nr:hypothetical protein BT96DRAFT_417891 [Gymnopus androsaceus JB14]